MASYPYFQSRQQDSPSGPGTQQPWGRQQVEQPPMGAEYAPSEPERPPGRNPSIDLVDNTDELWVYIDVPGFTADELQIRGDDTQLVVTADRLDEVEQGREVLVKERAARLERTIPLPAQVDIEGASATYEDGVCKVTLPKTATERLKQITVRST